LRQSVQRGWQPRAGWHSCPTSETNHPSICILGIMKRKRRAPSVFEDLGFRPYEAAHLQLRSAMMTRLISEIERQGLTQAAAARRMGVTQPRVSDLMRGKLHLFSIDTLVSLLSSLGLRVDLKVRRVA
jgi:predicted XRE-type DNA-binding protein